MIDPRRFLELLDRLEELGYDDQIHRVLHHHPRDTVARHRAYCRERATGFHSDGNNARFQPRLGLVLGAYEGGGFAAGDRDALFSLAHTARA